MKMTFYGHACFMVETEKKVVYFDPYKIVGSAPKANLILITHPHYDHFSEADLEKIADENTVVIAPNGCETVYKSIKLSPGGEMVLGELVIRAVHAYNLKKAFHPRENGWLGYIIETEGISIYHAGDTDFIPEMKTLHVDIAILPVGGTYTMDLVEAAEAVSAMKPKLAIPMHYGAIVGSINDAMNFCKKITIPCKVFQKGETWEIKV